MENYDGSDDFNNQNQYNGSPSQNNPQNQSAGQGGNQQGNYTQQNYQNRQQSGQYGQQSYNNQQGYNQQNYNAGQGVNQQGYSSQQNYNAQQGYQNPQGYAAQRPAAQQSQGASANQARSAKIQPTNLPPSEQSGSGPLNKPEIMYLDKIADQNFMIKKTTKRYSRASISSGAYSLSKVRRLYSARIGHKYYGCPIIQVNKLRGRANGGKGAAFGVAARKTKKLVLTIVIIVAILATLGTGAVVAVMAINNNLNNAFNHTEFIISNEANIPPNISNYVLGYQFELPIKIRNNTNQDVVVCFYISIKIEEDSELERAVAAGLVDPSKLEISYVYDEDLWRLVDDKLYYIGNGGVMADSAEDLQVISAFSIDIESTEESNKWVNYSMTLVFNVEFDRASNS